MTTTPDSTETSDQPRRNRRRLPVVAALLALWSPPVGMLYVDRPLRAAFYLGLNLVAIIGAVLLARFGAWLAGLSWVVVYLAIRGMCMADGYRIAKPYESGFTGPWYTTWKGLLAVAVVLIALPLSFRALLYEPFRQASDSMLPTLVEGDQVVVSKRAFDGSPPQRGDIIVFSLPGSDVFYLKRVVGLPGDVVDYNADNPRLEINGTEIELTTLGPYEREPSYQLAREILDGVEHLVVHMRFGSSGGIFNVPPEHYFVLGDNRDNSLDSRYFEFGFVPAANIQGKVVLIWWNTDEPKRAGTVPE